MLVLCCHGGALCSSFVYDDSWTIVHNSFIRSFANIPALLDGRAVAEQVPDAWRPLMVLSHMVDYRLFGTWPAGYHLHSLLWHLACVLICWWLARRITTEPVALVAAALFAVHPLHVEPVAAVSYREDLMAAALGLAAVLVLLPRGCGAAEAPHGATLPAGGSGRSHVKLTQLVAAAVLLVGGLMAKATALAIPPIYLTLRLLACAGERRHLRATALAGTASLAGAAGIFLAWRLVSSGSVIPYTTMGVEAATAGMGFREALLSHAGGFFRTAAQHLVPVGLSPEYPLPSGAVSGWLGLLLLAALLGGAFLLSRRGLRLEAAGILFFVLGWIPVSGLAPLPNVQADRYAYLPSFGFCLVAAALLLRVRATALRRVAVSLAILALIGLSLGQHRIWRSERALWSRAVQIAPGSGRAWAGLAAALSRISPAEAERAARRGVELSPRSGNSLLVLANALARGGKLEPALARYREAEQLGVRHPGILYANWGWTLHLSGLPREAEAMLRQSIAKSPRLAAAQVSLSRILAAQDRQLEAREAWRRAVELAPELGRRGGPRVSLELEGR